ncbi:MAG: phospho-N-acetylmuramoyl-pentapeptide-transferase [Glomeribacter sp. 1016415]|nr:phospho-N-acetylmuramoyl-pentapeptide-transferase [Glomeribacter sp. 1016415]
MIDASIIWLQLPSLALVAAVLVAAILRGLLALEKVRQFAPDVPNHRSLHTQITPRIGGWAMVPIIVLGMLGWARTLWPIALAALFVAFVSQFDDRRGLSARVRFAAHGLAVLTVMLGFSLSLAGWKLVLIVFLLLWLINLYNFMDGADGLAGGMTFFGFSAYAIAAASAAPDLAGGAALVAGAAAGFLVFNWPPARVFLGDAGSVPLGFLAGALGFLGWLREVWPFWFPALVFSPFIADASVTLCKRLLRGEKFWQAHRTHYYQRMIQMNGSHLGPVRMAYGLMAVSAVLALISMQMPIGIQWTVLAAWGLILILLGWRIDCRWRQYIQEGTY